MVDGGMVSLEVTSKAGPDVVAKCVDPGLVLSRANLTFQRDGQIVRARNAMLPVLSSKVRSCRARDRLGLNMIQCNCPASVTPATVARFYSHPCTRHPPRQHWQRWLHDNKSNRETVLVLCKHHALRQEDLRCRCQVHRDQAFTCADAQDWLDIDFAVKNEVDFIAVSFVKSADVMNNLKSYVRSRSPSTIEIVAKIESFDSVPNVQARSRTCH